LDMLKMLDLFSGIGGFSLAAESTGFIKTVAFCEIEPFCYAVLKKHWPDVPVYDDIKKLRGEDIGTVDIICGGPPCQPVSLAGKRKGKADDRWLWGEAIRIVEELKPRWCLFENPVGIISMGLDDVLSELESLGYETGTVVIPACAVGAPHRRDRAWIVAYSRCSLQQGSELRKANENEIGERFTDKPERSSKTCQNVAHANKPGLQRHGKPEKRSDQQFVRSNSERERAAGKLESCLDRVLDGFLPRLDGHRWPAPLGCEQYDWEPPRLVSGKVPCRRQRLQALGNAIVPQVAYVLFEAILAANLL